MYPLPHYLQVEWPRQSKHRAEESLCQMRREESDKLQVAGIDYKKSIHLFNISLYPHVLKLRHLPKIEDKLKKQNANGHTKAGPVNFRL